MNPRLKFLLWSLGASSVGTIFYFSSSQRFDVFALMFTATFIAWYSYETYQLSVYTRKTRNEMLMSNRISLAPGVVMEHEIVSHGGMSQRGFFIKNVGRGSAINIRIDGEGENSIFNFELRGINALSAGEKAPVWIRKNGNNLSDKDWEDMGSKPINVVIYFDRIKKHKTLFTKLEISTPPIAKITNTSWSL